MNIETTKILNDFRIDIVKLNISNENINIININKIHIGKRYITGKVNLDRFIKIKILLCDSNKITEFDNLSESLEQLNCFNNNITSLDNLPESLFYLI